MSYTAINPVKIFIPSMIIPLLTSSFLFWKFKKKKINYILIPVSIFFGLLTFFILWHYAVEYRWYEKTVKMYFNLFYLQLVLLPLTLTSVYYFNQDKGKMRYLMVILVIVMVIIYFILNFYLVSIDRDYVDYEYSVEIDLEDGSENYVLVPFPTDEDHNIEIYSSLSIESGSGECSIENTSHGTALNITFDGTIELVSKGETDKDVWSYDLSMHNSSQKYFIFSSTNDTIDIDVDYRLFGGPSGKTYRIESDVNEGWNLVEGEIRNIEG